MDDAAESLFRRADAVFDAALDEPPERRAAFVAERCGTDAELCAAVLRLLRASEASAGFLVTPAAELALPLLDAAQLPPRTSAIPLPRVGAFRLMHEIGRGGMGTVYMAERDDGHFRQRVALKLMQGPGSEVLIERFAQERQILASLEHPGIARLIDGGVTDQGVSWFAMEYVEGEPVDRYCESRGLDLDARLRIFRDICEAVEYAHRRRVVHRDLKPGNILVTDAGSVKLLDFGIAKLIETEADAGLPATRTTFRVMTPEYAAPEQVRGGAISTATDVYALGVLLYQLLAGERPYGVHGRTPGEVERIVCETEPVRPSALARRRPPTAARSAPVGGTSYWRRLRGDLDTITMTALQKNPAHRYASAGALLEDLRRFGGGLPLLARPASAPRRLQRFLRSRRARTAALITALVAAAAAGRMYAARSAATAASPALLAPASRILVADFTGTRVDSLLVHAVAEGVRIDLAQFPGIRVLSPQQVATALQHMGRPGELAVNDSLALELAAREGVAAIVSGDVQQVGGRIVLSARLVASAGGELLAAARETTDSTRLMAAVGRLTSRLRTDIGETRRSLRSSTPLAQVTTASLPALRAYTEGLLQLERHGNRDAAMRLLGVAVQLDPGFASAHRMLGSLYRANAEHERAAAAFELAFRHRERLAVRERFLTMGSYHLNITRDYDRAIEAYRAQLAREPDDRAALNNLAMVYREIRDFDNQEQLLRRLMAVDSLLPSTYHALAENLAHQARFDEAPALFAEVDRRFPDNPTTPMSRAYVAAAAQDWVSAEYHIRRRLAGARARGSTRDEIDARQTVGQILIIRGRLAEGERELRTALDLALGADASRRALFSGIQLGWLELRHRSDTARARAVVDSVLALRPLERVLSGDRPYVELSGFFAALGDATRVRALLELAVRDSAAQADLDGAAGDMMRGFDALLSGRAAAAVAAFRRRQAKDRCTNCGLPALGQALELAGEPHDAIRAYEQYLNTPYIWRFETDVPYLAWTMERLIELYQRHGRAADAAAMRARLSDMARFSAEPRVPR